MSDTQFWVTVGLWNLIVFSMYEYDKLCASGIYQCVTDCKLNHDRNHNLHIGTGAQEGNWNSARNGCFEAKYCKYFQR